MAGEFALIMGNSFGWWILLALLVVVVALMMFSAINDHRMMQAMRETLHHVVRGQHELVRGQAATTETVGLLLEHVGLVDPDEPSEYEECERLSGTLSEQTQRFDPVVRGRHR
jgi:hypothetical protein